MAKNIYIAYFLLFFGGLIGLHLLYLRRDMHAFLYWCTLGGYFGIGPLRDIFYIPSYVKDINEDPEYMAELAMKMRDSNKPPFSLVRFVGATMLGHSWCYVWVAAIPEEEFLGMSFHYLKYLGPLAAALGVWIVGNLGREKGSLKVAVLGSLLAMPLAAIGMYYLNWSSFSSALLFQFKAKGWRRNPYKKPTFCWRFMKLSLCWFLFCSVWASYIFFTAEITYKDGQRAKLKEAIPNFFKSPMFLEFKKNTWILFADVREHGFKIAWGNLLELIDPVGEYHALKILQLHKEATQQEITAQFKKLTKEWHPDRHTDAEMKLVAHDKFVEINEAYEKLSTIKKRRKYKNKMSKEDDYEETISL